MNTDTQSPQAAPKSGGAVQAILLVVLLLIGAVSGGYFAGTQMNFRKLQGGDAVGQSGGAADNEIANFGGFSESAQLKKAYWVHTRGDDRAGYKIAVFINGQFLGKFYKSDVDVEATKYLKPGRNSITFDCKPLPLDQRSDYSGAYLDIQLKAGDKKMDGDKARFENGDTLVEYRRKVTETEEFKDTKEFETLE